MKQRSRSPTESTATHIPLFLTLRVSAIHMTAGKRGTFQPLK